MLILSQNHKSLINTDLTSSYVVCGSEIRAFDGGKEYVSLGAYETIERTEEVLKELIEALKTSHLLKYPKSKLYEMPMRMG